jgi:hypothetical protein
MIQQLISEVSSLWWYAYGMIAGWGLSFSIVVGFLVLAHLKIAKLENEIQRYRNQMVAETRDLSFRINKLEK